MEENSSLMHHSDSTFWENLGQAAASQLLEPQKEVQSGNTFQENVFKDAHTGPAPLLRRTKGSFSKGEQSNSNTQIQDFLLEQDLDFV